MKMNKNLLAFAVCFATFAHANDDAIDNNTDIATPAIIENNNDTTIAMIAITPEEIAQLLRTSTEDTIDAQATHFVDGMIFNIDEITYIVKTDKTKAVEVSVNVTVVSDAAETTTTVTVITNSDDNSASESISALESESVSISADELSDVIVDLIPSANDETTSQE